ncbi:MAG: sialate O-acetylesterase [Planctomycetota bacterium]|jgi:hypothetical protein
MKTKMAQIAMSVLVVAGFSIRDAKSEGDWEIPEDASKFHIFIFAGQSNMAGGFNGSHLYDDEGNYDPLTKPVPRVLQYKRGGWVRAAHPTTKHVKTSFSIPLPFAQKYLEEVSDPEVKVGIYVTAFGGRAINFFVKGGSMHPGGTAALPKHGTVKGFIWHQGESDNRLEEREAYAQKLHGLVQDVRGYVGDPDLPFVTGAFNPKWAYSNPYSIPPGPPTDPEAKDMRAAYEAQITTGNVLAHIDTLLDKAAHVHSTGASHLKEHQRKLVDENGKLTGEIQGVKTDNTHFNRSGYTTLAYRYVDLILDRPAFKADPVIMVAVPGRPFTFDLRTAACDISKDKFSFSAENLPDWITVSGDGVLTGTAPAEGSTTFPISVTDKSGHVCRSNFLIVAGPPGAPKFKTEEYSRKAAVPGQLYKDRVYYHFRKPQSSDLAEPNNETVTFSKVDGPAWIEVHADGTFSGTPTANDAGQTQKLTVKAADADGEDTAEYTIPVLENGYVWHEGFKFQPDIPWVAVGDKLILDNSMPKDTWYIRSGHFPFTYTTQYSCYDVAGSLGANAYKFRTGSLRGIAFVLDGKRFGGKAGRVRFHIDLSDVEKPEPTGRGKNIQNTRAKRAEMLKAQGKIKEGEKYFFVTLYQFVQGGAEEDAVEVVLGDDGLYGRNAEVATRGTVQLASLAGRCFKPSDQGAQTLEFDYDGTGDILLVFSAVNDQGVGGGNRNFRNLSFRFIR